MKKTTLMIEEVGVRPHDPRCFPRTRWTIVAQAQNGDATEARRALETLCQQYWYPLYAYARWLGESAPDAEDVTQSFVSHLIERDCFVRADASKGKMRSFLCVMLKRFVIDERRKRQAIKRGGDARLLSLEGKEAEARFAQELISEETPERLFERRWAKTVIQRVGDLLREDYASRGRGEVYDGMAKFLSWNERPEAQKETAKELGMSVGALRMNITRMRQRFGELLKLEVAETLLEGEDVEEECQYLFRVL
ncbi:MAG: ECF-type sigma factor [Verrucomicrobiales bacterium]